MNGFALGFIVVALQALCGIGVLVKRDGMNGGGGARGKQDEKSYANPQGSSDPAACGRNGVFTKQNAAGKQGHSGTEKYVEHDGRREAKRACKRLNDNRFSSTLDIAQIRLAVIWITA
jgi:hypothetical protein